MGTRPRLRRRPRARRRAGRLQGLGMRDQPAEQLEAMRARPGLRGQPRGRRRAGRLQGRGRAGRAPERQRHALRQRAHVALQHLRGAAERWHPQRVLGLG